MFISLIIFYNKYKTDLHFSKADFYLEIKVHITYSGENEKILTGGVDMIQRRKLPKVN